MQIEHLRLWPHIGLISLAADVAERLIFAVPSAMQVSPNIEWEPAAAILFPLPAWHAAPQEKSCGRASPHHVKRSAKSRGHLHSRLRRLQSLSRCLNLNVKRGVSNEKPIVENRLIADCERSLTKFSPFTCHYVSSLGVFEAPRRVWLRCRSASH